MSYKIGNLPSPQATLEEIADYIEIECLLSDEGTFSIVEAAQDSGFVEDEEEIHSIGTDSYNEFAEALQQIDSRSAFSTSEKYPFVAETKTVSFNESCSEYYRTLYSFLLFATRRKMGADRIVNQKDGTLLFERLCEEVLAHYFGPHAKTMVFGTGATEHESFEDKVKKLLQELKEKGYQFCYPDGVRHYQKDGRIDLVAFTPFNDDRKGHFIAFGQCKTGTSWRDQLGQMNPLSFSQLHVIPPLRFTPISIYMVSEACDCDWELLASRASGLLFDRTRIVQFLPDNIHQDLYNDIATWVQGVKEEALKD